MRFVLVLCVHDVIIRNAQAAGTAHQLTRTQFRELSLGRVVVEPHLARNTATAATRCFC